MLSPCVSSGVFDSVPSPKSKILIVDDQIENIQLLHMLLEDDYDIFMATDGEQGVAQCRKHIPDLVLLDVTMPGLDGYQVCDLLKKDISTKHIPIIFITGHVDDSEEVKGFELGAADYIRKPINPTIIEKRIQTQLLLKYQNERLSSLTMLDGLTGVANRRSFFHALQKIWHECVDQDGQLSIIMLDVDDFKVFNYTHGHIAGDTALKMMSHVLQQYFQENLQLLQNLVARYNGEEFCCLLPFVSLSDAIIVAEELRTRVETLNIDNKKLTVSVGVVNTTSNQHITTPELLLFEVNKCLSLAKKSGKNCIKYTDN